MIVNRYKEAVESACHSAVLSRRERRRLDAERRRKPVNKSPARVEDNRPTVFTKGRAKVVKESKYPMTYKQQQRELLNDLCDTFDNLCDDLEMGLSRTEELSHVIDCITNASNVRSKYGSSSRKLSASTPDKKTVRKASSAGMYANARHHSRTVYISPEQRKANKIKDGKPVMNTKRKPALVSVSLKSPSVPKKCGKPMSRKQRLKLESQLRKQSAVEEQYRKEAAALEEHLSKAA